MARRKLTKRERLEKERKRQKRLRQRQQRAEQAAAALRDCAWVREDGSVRLDPWRVLSPGLTNAPCRVLTFHLGPDTAVRIERSRLKPARRALKPFDDLVAWLDADGLHFRWRQGYGGLTLRLDPSRELPEQKDALPLCVSFYDRAAA